MLFLLGACNSPKPHPAAAPEASAPGSAIDQLPTWNDGTKKQAIIDFVKLTIPDSNADFVQAPERTAVFHNDGTLWSEAPMPRHLAFIFSEIKRRAPQEPELAKNRMVKATTLPSTEPLQGSTMWILPTVFVTRDIY